MKHVPNYNFVGNFKISNLSSLFLVLVSLILIFFKGLNFGIDFKGGTLIELRVDSKIVGIADIRSSFSNINLGDLNVKQFGKEGDYLIKFEKKNFDDKNNIKTIKENVKNKLQTDVNFRRVENVGPKVSAELLNSGLLAIALALGAMLFYIWVRFEWQFSVGSILAIFHDVLITIGLFSFLSLEINLSIVAAVLTIVGYSMNDTVVIYDRIRENLSKFSSSKIEEITNTSINETLSRTIITSLTTLLALISIFVLGGEILRGFALAMIIGVIIGTYSSIFVASPILKYLNVSYKTIAKDQENN
ncbi:MAG: protein translocase subunit SecF [Pelagibacteraceae bacterium]|nr:protein translocase subunit SecF [Pelagibacteraceae bacterium]